MNAVAIIDHVCRDNRRSSLISGIRLDHTESSLGTRTECGNVEIERRDPKRPSVGIDGLANCAPAIGGNIPEAGAGPHVVRVIDIRGGSAPIGNPVGRYAVWSAVACG